MSFEDEYKRGPKKKNPIAPFLPVIGFLLAGVAAVISFILSDPVHKYLIRQFGSQIPREDGVRYLIAAGLFLIIVMFVAMIYAAFSKKPPKMVSERELERERREMDKEKVERKKRRRQIAVEAKRQRERQQNR